MLVLELNLGESIFIGADISIAMVRDRKNRTRLGITAPKTMPVDRYEIYIAKHGESAITEIAKLVHRAEQAKKMQRVQAAQINDAWAGRK